MNYHNIKHCDMVNGEGLRVTLFVSGCSHNCYNCQNPQTHDPNSGVLFDGSAKEEIFSDLRCPWCSGLTISGGDPLYPLNRDSIHSLLKEVKSMFPTKTVWLYTGYTYEELLDDNLTCDILSYVDVLVDGVFIQSKYKYYLKWRSSANQRVIDLHTRIDLV